MTQRVDGRSIQEVLASLSRLGGEDAQVRLSTRSGQEIRGRVMDVRGSLVAIDAGPASKRTSRVAIVLVAIDAIEFVATEQEPEDERHDVPTKQAVARSIAQLSEEWKKRSRGAISIALGCSLDEERIRGAATKTLAVLERYIDSVLEKENGLAELVQHPLSFVIRAADVDGVELESGRCVLVLAKDGPSLEQLKEVIARRR